MAKNFHFSSPYSVFFFVIRYSPCNSGIHCSPSNFRHSICFHLCKWLHLKKRSDRIYSSRNISITRAEVAEILLDKYLDNNHIKNLYDGTKGAFDSDIR
ncbi:hypothetical protein IEQ34_011150 [Dendrobium chrysotoxum]|uniref:Uncharacterized protein n=1 Tax=Dendrobium chrysotoxum TaxID=161865 RepID=A0AAV7GY64_DENCH|nr:hypothetical protein IEQ34_011150 [Dendrobium chrysotoxum]